MNRHVNTSRAPRPPHVPRAAVDPLTTIPPWTAPQVRRLIRWDPECPYTAPHQLVERFRQAIAVGELLPGTMLPPLRLVHRALDVHRDGVWTAYRRLRDLGLVVVRSGRGTWVAQRACELAIAVGKPRVVPSSDPFAAAVLRMVADARDGAVTRERLITCFRTALDAVYPLATIE